MYDIIIIGAGASGLMAASNIKNKKILIIDKNKKIGEKIKISGGAKCNITNKYMDQNYFLGDKEFIKSVLNEFDNKHLLEFLHKNRVYPKVLEKIVKGTYFCNSSNDVLVMFKHLTKHCSFQMNTEVLDVDYTDGFRIKTNQGSFQSKQLIVASGGLSYQSIGATDIGFKIAQKFGHRVIKLNPALVGFTVQKEQFWFKELSGLSLDVRITIGDKKVEGKMLFTHKGCSGPAILTTSLYWEKGQFSIDFLPYKDSYLPKRFRQAVKNLDIDLHNYQMAPAGNFGYTKAEVTKGGVDTKGIIDGCESKIQKRLFFIGEVLNVTGELGGYNFQWAFSSAKMCSKKM
jgi:predicted Rossmann fold flavoprotein